MTIESLYFLIQSGEGFSVRPDGYLTYAGDGYAVGGAHWRVFTMANEILSFNVFKREMERLSENSIDASQVIGGWVDDDGIVYLEVSDVIKSKHVAIELAKARGEKAIYDFANAKSIDV